MKITVGDNKPVFKPITITLETAQEYLSLVAALGSGTYKGEVEQLEIMGFPVSTSNYESSADTLHELLFNYINKVKETL